MLVAIEQRSLPQLDPFPLSFWHAIEAEFGRCDLQRPVAHVHPGDPLNQTALLDTQRKLYDLTLFNQVNTAVQNPLGDELRKNVLLQFTEARRWDFSYGFGFQVQTGNPQTSCNNVNPLTLIQLGINPATL